jgi:hypothetical protein
MANKLPPHILGGSEKQLKRAMRRWQRMFESVDWDRTQRALDRYKAAVKENKIWESALGRLMPWQIAEIMHRLPGSPGRPRGTGPIANDAELLAELTARTNKGEKPTSAAMAILKERGVKAGLKNRADHLVRVWKREKSGRDF